MGTCTDKTSGQVFFTIGRKTPPSYGSVSVKGIKQINTVGNNHGGGGCKKSLHLLLLATISRRNLLQDV